MTHRLLLLCLPVLFLSAACADGRTAPPCGGACPPWQVCNAVSGRCELRHGRCERDTDCVPGYGCLSDRSCAPLTECLTNLDCADERYPVCRDGSCVPGRSNLCALLSCDEWEICNFYTESCELGRNRCHTEEDCLPGTFCNIAHECEFIGECSADADCTDTSRPVCLAGLCTVECSVSDECGTDAPLCSHGRCVPETTQCSNGEELRVMESSFLAFVKGLSYAQSDDGHYQPPPEVYLDAFEEAVGHMIGGNFCQAQLLAAEADMEVFKLIDTDRIAEAGFTNEYFCMAGKTGNGDTEPDPAIYRGVYCVRNHLQTGTYTRNIHISVPHPLYDINTHMEGAQVFRDTNARYFSLSTSHRRSSPEPSRCDPLHQRSDVAHNVDTLFHRFTARLQDLDRGVYHIQLHGYDAGDGRDVAVTSVGTRNDYNAFRPIRVFTDNLRRVIAEEEQESGDSAGSAVICCSDPEDSGNDALCSLRNMQGRYINGSTLNTCDDAPVSFVNSRFIHLEQSRWIRGFALANPSSPSYLPPRYPLVVEALVRSFTPVLVMDPAASTH